MRQRLLPALAATIMIGCATPTDRVILLPAPDGKVGQIVIRSSAAPAERLDTAYAAREIDRAGTITPRLEDAASVRARYSAVLDARPPRPRSFTLYFASGSAQELTPESKAELEKLKAVLTQHPSPEISVIGHTDRVGKLEANDALSLKRAEAVGTLLRAAGIQAHVEFAGRGEREPLVDTADEVPEPANRRVEINLR